MTISRVVVSILVSAFLLSCQINAISSTEKPTTRPDFSNALQAHLNAIQNRDLTAFRKTLTSNDDLNVIFPNGHLLENTQAVVNFHADWFQDDKWIFKPQVEKIIEGNDMATVLLKYTYQDDLNTEPRPSWLVLVFKLENNEWRLVHDQNTRIEKVAP